MGKWMSGRLKRSTNEFELRGYRAGDETAILDLFQNSFGSVLPLEYWRWRYLNNPAGGPWIELAFDGPNLAAQYAVCGAALCVNGQRRLAAMSMTTMTHPKYRGLGLFPILAERLYGRLEENGSIGVFGFPNRNSHRGFVRDLHWEDLYEIPSLNLAIGRVRNDVTVAPCIQTIDEPSAGFDGLWQKIKNQFPIWTWRDATYLRWRYNECPNNKYYFIVHAADAELSGYAIFKYFGNQSIDILDLQGENETVVHDLVHWIVAKAKNENVETIAMWSSLSSPWRLVLESIGFEMNAPITYLGGRAFGRNPSFESIGNWGYAMSDSDVY
jgi:hypothetical protein